MLRKKNMFDFDVRDDNHSNSPSVMLIPIYVRIEVELYQLLLFNYINISELNAGIGF